jgi:agmatinase
MCLSILSQFSLRSSQSKFKLWPVLYIIKLMLRLLASNVNSLEEADICILGLPDESKSDAKRTSTNKGPDFLRGVYNDSLYFENAGGKIPILPISGSMNKKIFDFGNVIRHELFNVVFDISSLGKIPIILGGDHSLTSIALGAVSESLGKKMCLLYFDAHPDFVTSVRDYHGSVLADSSGSIDFEKSVLIGIRATEAEELENINKNHLELLSPLSIVEEGLSSVAKMIISKCEESCVYLSIDLDCIDPAIAPGVSVPTTPGLMPVELIYLVKKLCSNLRVVGLDLVELSPDYDQNNNTANIGARVLMEAIASLRVSNGI